VSGGVSGACHRDLGHGEDYALPAEGRSRLELKIPEALDLQQREHITEILG